MPATEPGNTRSGRPQPHDVRRPFGELILKSEILEQAADPIIAVDTQERILYLNRSAERIYGARRDQAIGQRLSELYTWRWLRPEDEAQALRALADGGVWRGDNIHVTGDGRELHVESTVAALRDEDGQTIGLLATIRDVSDRRETEEALREALQAKDAFLGLISHELRTPMTVILGMSRLLAKGGLTGATTQDLATDIVASAEELDDLIESMLMLARLDGDEVQRTDQPTLLSRVVETVLQRQRERDRSRVYRLDVETASTLVEADEMWLERVILNFLGNASKYSRPGLPVTVVIEAGVGEIIVRVLDEGDDLQAHELPELFKPFVRGAAHAVRTPGAGLGLTVCERIIRVLGGRVWARPRPGGGAEFGFALPMLTPGEPWHE